MADEQVETQVDPAIEREARTLGWRPEGEYRGPPGQFVDAAEFVQRGRTILPIIRENNKHLTQQVQSLQASLQDAHKAIEDLKDLGVEVAKDRIAAVKASLKTQLKAAREANDVDAEVELTDKLGELRDEEKIAQSVSKPVTKANGADPKVDPDFQAWMSDNPWFGPDKRRTALAQGIAAEMRGDSANASLVGRAFFDKVTEEVEAVMNPTAPTRKVDKVEGSRGGAGGSGSRAGKKDYAALPADAKATCDRQAAKFAGKGKAFEDKAAWQTHYAKLYFSDEE